MNTIRTRFVRIGNSRGLRIPKVLIDQLNLGGEVEVTIQGERLVVQSATQQRKGWDKAFQSMAKSGDDVLLDEMVPTDFDESEWTW